jgi:hypothetical protein
MSSPIDQYEGADVVYTFGANSFGTWLLFILAVLAFLFFIARVAGHENSAYKAMENHEEPSPGPAVEGEPEVAAI